MNTIEHFVTEVLGEPYQVEPFTHWFVNVLANSYGRISEGSVMVKTLEEAEAISVGYKYDA